MAETLINFVAEFPGTFQSGCVRKFLGEGELAKVLHFIPVDGQSYAYGEDASAAGIAYRSLNESYSDSTGVINPKVEHLRIFGGEVRTDTQLFNKQGGAARANEIARRIARASLFFDREVIKGLGATDPKAITGLQDRLVGDQVLAAGANGAALTKDMIDDLLDRVYGLNEKKLLIMNKACRRALKHDLLSSAGVASVGEMGGSLPAYDGVPILVLDEDGDQTAILDFDETCGTSEVTASVYCIHPGSTTDREGLQGLIGSQGIERHDAGCQGTFYLDVVEMNVGIAVFNARAAARLMGIVAEAA